MKENENGLAYIQMLYNIFHRIIELVKEWFDLFLQEYFCYCKYYNHDISVMKLDYFVSTIIVQPNIFCSWVSILNIQKKSVVESNNGKCK